MTLVHKGVLSVAIWTESKGSRVSTAFHMKSGLTMLKEYREKQKNNFSNDPFYY